MATRQAEVICGPVDPAVVTGALESLNTSWPDVVPFDVRAGWSDEQLDLHRERIAEAMVVAIDEVSEELATGCMQATSISESAPDAALGWDVLVDSLIAARDAPGVDTTAAAVLDLAAVRAWEDGSHEAVCEAGEDMCDTLMVPWCEDGEVIRDGDCGENESTCGKSVAGYKRCCKRDAGYMCLGGNQCVARSGGGGGGIGGGSAEVESCWP